MDRSDCDKFHKKGVFTESQHYGHGFSPSVSARHELNPNWSLTIYNAASGPYSLRVMTIITVFVLPFVLAYQAWKYWVVSTPSASRWSLDYWDESNICNPTIIPTSGP